MGMGMTIKDLFKISILSQAKFVAGHAGRDNEITWFNLMEIIDSVNSLQEKEFLITTGYDLDKPELSKNLISKLQRRGLAGIGIQLGYYIDSIPQNLIDDANETGFPIIEIPEKLTFSTITKTLYSELMSYQNADVLHDNDTKTILMDSLEERILDKRSKSYLADFFGEDDKRTVYLMLFHIHHMHSGIILRTDSENSLNSITHVLKQNHCMIHEERIGGNTALLFSIPADRHFKRIRNELDQAVIALSKSNFSFVFSLNISSPIQSLNALKPAYNETIDLLQQMNKIEAKKGAVSFEDMNLLYLLNGDEARKELLTFSRRMLADLIEYDRNYHKDYFKTFQVYICNNCSLQESSSQLYLHRHTLKYRLERLLDLFHIDYLDSMVIMKYALAFFIYNLYD